MKKVWVLAFTCVFLLLPKGSFACFSNEDGYASEVLLSHNVHYDLSKLEKISKDELIICKSDNERMTCAYSSPFNEKIVTFVYEDEEPVSGSGEYILKGDLSLGIRVQAKIKNFDEEKGAEFEEISSEEMKDALRKEIRFLEEVGVIKDKVSENDLSSIIEKTEKGSAGYNGRIIYSDRKYERYYDTGLPLIKISGCSTVKSALFMNNENKYDLNKTFSVYEIKEKISEISRNAKEEKKDSRNTLTVIGIFLSGLIIMLGSGIVFYVYNKKNLKTKKTKK